MVFQEIRTQFGIHEEEYLRSARSSVVFISFRSQPWRYEEGLVVVIVIILILILIVTVTVIVIVIVIIIVPSYAWFKDVGRFRLADCS